MAIKQYWKIAAYDGADQTFEKLLPAGSLSKREIIALLQRLAAKHLDENMIVACSLRRNAPGYSSLLEPQFDRGGRRPAIIIHAGRSYDASIWGADELADHKE